MGSENKNAAQTYLELGWTGPHITWGSGYDLQVCISNEIAPEAYEALASCAEKLCVRELP